MITVKRDFTGWKTAPSDGGISEMDITLGAVIKSLTLIVPYSVNVTTAGTAVRNHAVPVKRVSLVCGSKVLHSIKGSDLVSKGMIFGGAPIGTILTPPSGFAIANYAGCLAVLKINFTQPQAANGILTSLPSYAYPKNLTLRVEWGSVTDLLVGAPVGPITFGATTRVRQNEYSGITPPIGDGRLYAATRGVSIDRYAAELAVPATTAATYPIDIGIDADIRAIMVTAENSTGEAVDTLIASIGLKENNTNDVYANVDWAGLGADNAQHYRVTPPVGVRVIEFAEDGDITQVYDATKKRIVTLNVTTNSIAGISNVRAHLLTIAPPAFAL